MPDEAASPARTTARVSPPRKAPDPGELVDVRVTKFGDGKVFTGDTPVFRRPEFDEGEHWFPTYRKDQIIKLPRRVAEAQEALGHVEIQD